mmetsp:Transcript_45338/g.106386  ORF Transcript_45338/g.106386 Transcript_45338/m.106386 type:complete len:190 (-) Transcript_45338:248-817(-)
MEMGGSAYKENSSDDGQEDVGINYKLNRFPYAVVWQPFPPLTWILPMAGHTGITDSRGVVHDFQGPYFVEEGRMMLGRATRYIQLDPNKVMGGNEGENVAERWDRLIGMGCDDYRKRIHCIIYPNCNHHVAHCLNKLKYNGWEHWEMFQLWWMVLFHSKYCGLRGFLISMLPFLIILTIVLAVVLAKHL